MITCLNCGKKKAKIHPTNRHVKGYPADEVRCSLCEWEKYIYKNNKGEYWWATVSDETIEEVELIRSSTGGIL